VTTDHQPSLPLSVFGHPNAATTLLWHPAAGSDPDQVAAIAKRLSRGRRIVVPVWSDGRDLLRSVRYARQSAVHPPDQLTIVGYGAAGIAALSLALHQRRLGIALQEAVCVGGGPGMTDPISGQPLPEPPPAPSAESRTTLTLVAGSEPEDGAWVESTAAAWRAAGWQVEVETGPVS
jgi:dienelactone hydrolase